MLRIFSIVILFLYCVHITSAQGNSGERSNDRIAHLQDQLQLLEMTNSDFQVQINNLKKSTVLFLYCEHITSAQGNSAERSNDRVRQLQEQLQLLERTNSDLQAQISTLKKSTEATYSPDSTTDDVMRKITINRDRIESLSASLVPIQDALKKITDTYDSIVALNTNPIPIGFIYIEYMKQSGPSVLWPTMTWIDVTHEFAGQFFRAYGGGSAGWDQVQPACAPMITEIDNKASNAYSHNITFPTNGWSARLFTGKWAQLGTATRFNVNGCEVRPINSAVRIWKRVT